MLQYTYILVLAIGMVIVIIGGHIDLSVGAVLALAGAVSAVLVIKNGLPWWVGVLAAIGVGLLVGAWQGFWVAFVGIPAFITTLAGMLLFRGMTWAVLHNVSLSGFPKEYQSIGNGFFNGLIGGNGYDLFTLVVFAIALVGYCFGAFRARRARIAYNQPVASLPVFFLKILAVSAVVMWFAWQLAHARGLPYVLIILGSFVIIYTVVTTRTVFGRHVYAIGGNLAAATLSGVKVKWVNFGIMLNMGFLCWRGGRALLRPTQWPSAAVWRRLRTRRDRGMLHRWCGRDGRRRSCDRCDRRWSGDGRAVERHAADGRRPGHPADRQGPRPCGGRGIRRAQ